MTRQWRRRLGIGIALAVMLCISSVWADSISAHAQFRSSVPAPNATVNTAPTQVAITFSEETSPTKSGGSVADANGAAVSTGFKVDLNDRTKMTIDLKPNLPNGTYTVKWNTFTEDDSGMADGTFTFTVQSAQQAATAPAGTTPTATTTTGSPASGTAAPTATRAATTPAAGSATTTSTTAPTATRSAASAVATGTGGATLPTTGNPDSGATFPWLALAAIAAAVCVITGFALRYRATQRR